MNKAIYIDYQAKEATLGQSKFFGTPDLPDDFDWPVDEDDYDMDFICQINCSDVHRFNPAIPEKGMLYFFGCIANPLGEESAPAVTAGFQSMANFAVIYDDSDKNDLLSGEIVDENGNEVGFSELVINFSENQATSSEAFHQLLGDAPDTNDEIKDYELLFCLDSFSGDDFTLEFEDSGYLYFLIRKDDLLNRNFEKVICYLSV